MSRLARQLQGRKLTAIDFAIKSASRQLFAGDSRVFIQTALPGDSRVFIQTAFTGASRVFIQTALPGDSRVFIQTAFPGDLSPQSRLRRALLGTLLLSTSAILFSAIFCGPAPGQDVNNTDGMLPPPTVQANDEQYLKKGIELYKAGNYREAVGQFGMALPRDFSNAVLHYYLANTYINLKQPDAAIREFRIAYAIAPRKEVGQLSRKALSYLGSDNFNDGIDKAAEKPKKDAKPLETVDPVFAKTIETLKKQAGSSPGLTSAPAAEKNISNRIDDMIKVSKSNIAEALIKVNPDELKVPREVKDQLLQIKLLNDAKYKLAGPTTKMGDSVRDSAESLQALLKEKNSKTAPHLVPHGTNLYIRNYQAPGALGSQAPGSPSSTSADLKQSESKSPRGMAPSAGTASALNSSGSLVTNQTGASSNVHSEARPEALSKHKSSSSSVSKSKASGSASEKPTKLWGVILR